MIKELEYSSAIKDMPFLFLETRKTAGLIADGKTKKEIIDLSLYSNIFQLEKERRRKELPMKILKRLKSIDKDLINIIATGRDENAKLIVFLSIIKTDKLFFEFMCEVYSDKYISGQNEITDTEFITFLDSKSHESEKVAKWTKSNLEKVKGAYKKILCEAGLAKKQGNDLEIVKAICDDEITNHIKPNDIYAKSMLLSGV